ncbi:MAG: autotransporter outer membrane beta-barrel domain-containing protein [Ahniella sp.]|nr:autotransporter outer membrane beta-barrel domain-containing protein [Ahniella sp.]
MALAAIGLSSGSGSVQAGPPLACPPPAEFPTTVTIVEGQLAPIGVGQVDPSASIPLPDLNVNYEILGGAGLRLFGPGGQNFTFVVPWVPISPMGFEYHHSNAVQALPNSSSGSPYTVNVTLQDPNGCGPTPPPTAFTVNVNPAVSPTLAVSTGDGQVANTGQGFPAPVAVQVTENGSPLLDVVIVATVTSGDITLRPVGVGSFGPGGYFFSDPSGIVNFEVLAGATPGPATISFSAAEFTGQTDTVNLTVNGVAPTLTCPPPATLTPPQAGWVEGQIAEFAIGETLPAAMAPTPVNAAWRIDGNPATVEFIQSQSNQFDEIAPWTEISAGQFQYDSFTQVKFKAGSSGGSSQNYTVRAYANDPGGCGTFMADRTFNITVDAPTAPSVTQQGASPAATAAPTETFLGNWRILVTNNGSPLPNALVRFNVVSGDGGFGPPVAPPGPDGRPPPPTEVFVTTNGAGIAETAVIAGTVPGPLVVRASAPDFAPGQNIDLNLTVDAGAAIESFQAVPTSENSGSPYGAIAGQLFGPFQITAVQDFGNGNVPVPGVPIRFTVNGDGQIAVNGSIVGTSTVITSDTIGVAEIEVYAGTTTLNSQYTLTAEVDSGPFTAPIITWHLINFPEPNTGTITITGGNNQTIEPGQSFSNLDFDVTVNSIRAPEGAILITLDILQGDATFPAIPRGPGGSSTSVLVPFLIGTSSYSIPLLAGTTEGPVTVRIDGVGFVPQQWDLAIQTAAPPPPSDVEVVSGTQQSAVAGAPFAEPLVAALPAGFLPASPTDAFLYSVVSGDVFLNDGGSPVRSLSILPDGSGRATVPASAGIAAGSALVQVEFPGLTPAQFALTVNASPTATLITKVSGDNQSAAINTRLAAPLVINTTGTGTLAWRVVRGTATLVGATNGLLSTTITNGTAQAQAIMGNTAGPVEIEVAGQGFQATRFAATATLPLTNYRIEKVSGDLQTLRLNQPSQPIRIRVTDGGVPLTNFNVTWAHVGPGQLNTSQTVTNALGETENVYTPLNSGLAFVRATVTNPNGGAAATADFTLNTPITVLRLLNATPQTGSVGSLADEDFMFQLSQDDLAISGERVDFSIVGAGSLNVDHAITDGNGKVFVRLRYGSSAGPVLITASALGGAATATASATAFSPGLSSGGGNNQSGRPGELLPEPLVVQISQPPGEPTAKGLAGVPVLWTVTCGGGTLQSGSTTTDAQGRSSNRFTLGPAPGCNDVKANVLGVGEFLFSATGEVPASGIEIVSGEGQNLAPGEPSAPLVVRVVNASGQTVRDVRIVFEPTANGVTVDPSEVLTNDQGRAQTIARVNLPGQFQVRAKAADFPGLEPKLFTLTASLANTDNLPPAVREIAAVIDNSCVALSQIANPTPLQQDLLQRCSELVANSDNAPGEVSNALNELQVEEGGNQNQVALAIANGQFDNLNNRMTALRNGSAGNGFQNNLAFITSDGALQMGYLPGNILGMNAAEEPEAGAQFSRWGFFASGTIGRGKRDPFEEDPGFDFRTYGITAGVDYRLNDAFVLGAALGLNRNNSDVRGNRGGTDTSGTSLSGYVSWYHPQSFYLDTVLSIGQTQFDIERRISYSIPGANGGRTQVNQIASASPDGNQTSVSVSFGKDWNRNAWAFGPYARLNYTRIDFDGYTEQMSNPNGLGAGLALSVEGREIKSMQGVFGGKVSYTTSTTWGVLVPYVQMEWVKEFEDDPGEIVSRFAFDPTRTAIIIENDAIDTDYLNFGLGLSGVFANGKSAFLYYERVMGQERTTSDSLSAGMRIEF